ncbi:MAG: DUF3313 domain-containing protein [Gammaproteobacteria bacterium]|nr:DUF3313 domain-containing protein [Gammaproteobacteria bacterium]
MGNDGKINQAISIAAAVLISSAILFASPAVFAQKKEPPQETHDGLTLIEDRKVAAAYIDSDADLSIYNKIMILDCYVAFKKDWQKDQKKTGSRIRVSSSDMERIKADVAALFRDVFTEKLGSDDGYEIVTAAGDDVLLVRPAIIDLDVTAPDTMTAGRTSTYTTSAGAATLYIELYDSVTGDILARAVDRKEARKAGGYLSYSNRVTNRSDARRLLGRWAGLLREKLDELHGK